MATWDAIAQLPVSIDGYSLSGLEQPMGPEFIRACTLIDLHGGGEHGVGEDVVYDQLDHIAFQDAGQVLDLTGPSTLGELSELHRRPGPVPGLAAGARALAQLPPLGVRVGGAGPGAAPGRPGRSATWSAARPGR